MNRLPATGAAVAALCFAVYGAAAFADAPDAAAAMRTADEVLYPHSYSMTVSIVTDKPGHASSSMTLEVANKAGRGAFIEMVAPARSKGTRFLQTKSSLYLYSPNSGSRMAIRLSPRESFQGSAFSNNDVSDSSWSNDYEASLAGSGQVDSQDFGKVDAWIIVGKALRRDVPYGEIRIYMKKDDLLPLKVEYFAKSGLPLKTMALSDYAKVAGRLRPGRMTMETSDGTGEKSVVTIADLRERNDLPDAMFNQSWLTR